MQQFMSTFQAGMLITLYSMHGIVTEDTKYVQMSPKQCTRCSTMNSPTTKFCSKCGIALDIKVALEIEEKVPRIRWTLCRLQGMIQKLWIS